MTAVVQRVSRASVTVDGETVGAIGRGLMILLGVTHGDGEEEARWLAGKVAGLRIYEDAEGKMNRGLLDVGGSALVVSQFTLYGDCRKGNRPSFVDAAHPEKAEDLYEVFLEQLKQSGLRIASGRFQAMMDISLVNQGPVTVLLDSRKGF